MATHKRRSVFFEESPDNAMQDAQGTLVTSSTSKKEEASQNQAFDIEQLFAMSDGGLSEILNAVDGIADTHGRILILTTNNRKELDPALLRPGRIDLQLELGYVDENVFVDFMKAFFPEYEVPKGYKIQDGVPVSDLQHAVLVGKTAEEIVNENHATSLTAVTSVRN